MEFDLAKEQARLSLAIQDARRSLDVLIAEKSSFLKEREEDAKKAVQDALALAKSTIEETNVHVKAMDTLVHDSVEIVSSISAVLVHIREERKSHIERTKELFSLLEAKQKELLETKIVLKSKEDELERTIKTIALEKKQIAEERQKITVEQERLRNARQLLDK